MQERSAGQKSGWCTAGGRCGQNLDEERNIISTDFLTL